MPRVVAVDAGTTSVRAVVVDDAGHVVDQAGRRLTQHFPRPGWVEHDPAEIWEAVRTTLCEVLARLPAHEDVTCLGITNQRETVIPWDRATGRALGRAVVWQDRRTARWCATLIEEGADALVRARTGLVLDPYFSATKMAWLLNEGGLRDSAPAGLSLATVDTWVLWNLTGGTTGGVFATDATNAARTMLFDIDGLTWSDELCDLFGVPSTLLPDVRPSCGRLGIVDTSSLGPGGERLAGVPISSMAGDQHAALFGQMCFEVGQAKATYGTGTFVLANAGPTRPADADGLLTTLAWDLGAHGGSRPPVAYALEGSTFSSGATIQWLRDGLGLISEAGEVGPLAESVPDSGGLSIVPALAGLGSPWWDPTARGTVTGIARGVGRAHMARALVEALALEVRAVTDAMQEATGRPITTLRVDGGASVLRQLLQLQADQIRVPVARPGAVESTALGAATMAGLAEGVWGSLDELAERWRPEVTYRPVEAAATADALYRTWLRSVERARRWAPR